MILAILPCSILRNLNAADAGIFGLN
jgi:hypothetical protein